MDINTPEQCASAYRITDYYHSNVIAVIKEILADPADEAELEIVSALLRGSVSHLVNEARQRLKVQEEAVGAGG